MQDDHFEPKYHEAARRYHEPPALDNDTRDRMWAGIETATSTHRAPRRYRVPQWLGLAAAIVVGIAIGRFTPLDRLLHPAPAAPLTPAASVAASAPAKLPLPAVYEPTTSQYLDQTAALLVSLPSEAGSGRPDKQFMARATNLLLTTRLLLDSPAAQDAKLHGLLDDLEVVLAQIVRLQDEQNHTDLDLINQALEQHDVLPRLRTAAADLSAD
ncbi:MAG: hypothetical protein KGL38_11505 [Gemmatimonadota bacterium]|nr:hypothetical protein [Gemmatimonadota bacterium]MDE3128625.1 hypothetical protein [Gemmatimonadota bacterium]MDE3174245.1 hypothetical protein [Gemmatimonadota bacterium]MDE3215437.1 hypothetical protein [Gemmatimonadota bacterium]